MRIIAGKHRGRRLAAPPGEHTRPTAEKGREALFNILIHADFCADGLSPLIGARVLDAFCGTGALGLEAISRGAAHAVLMEKDKDVLELARRNAERLGVDHHVTAVAANATRPGPTKVLASLAFLDPPYGKGLVENALPALARQGWLAPGALVVAEIGVDESFTLPEGFALLRESRQGAAKFVFLRYRED